MEKLNLFGKGNVRYRYIGAETVGVMYLVGGLMERLVGCTGIIDLPKETDFFGNIARSAVIGYAVGGAMDYLNFYINLFFNSKSKERLENKIDKDLS